ncbi:ParB/RepB/Spo0J family partition protein [Pedobacter nutrimenti]|uniref:ParB/RepB/Spo0J family partition protein n=1 Tax=Pedobacter nutrimenti TaxID=1241337 RepID=A0A318UAG5_9SPHI|nr:ParB/RepB/Spo0J family partition protein [Pedobacter nutrimenti]PYF68447.1 ParB/RepB/Spo0J family partition protein [Pedobacter nutrimenti]
MSSTKKKKAVQLEPIDLPILTSDEVKLIPIDLIDVISNYRKYFNEEKTLELASNLQTNGLIHPVLCRMQNNGRYGLVSGERRYRASILAGFTVICSTVRDLSDEQVLDIQISENLQREDTSPLEDCSAYQILVDKGLSVNDVALKLGKSPSFIAGRLSLVNLIDEFQQTLLEDKLPITHAIYLSRQEKDNQNLYWNFIISNPVYLGSFKNLKSFFEVQIEVPLSKAKFDKDDSNLVQGIGACTNCIKNSACNLSLFSDKSEDTCLDRKCFDIKTDAFEKNYFLSLPDDILIVRGQRYYEDNSQIEFIKQLSEDLNIHEYDIIERTVTLPVFNEEEPIPEEFENGELDEDYIEQLQEYKEAVLEHEKDVQEYHTVLNSSPELNKGCFISGKSKGQVFHFFKKEIVKTQLSENNNIDPVLKALNDRKDGHLQRIKRGLEIDAEKIHSAQAKKIKELDYFNKDNFEVDSDLNEAENNAILISMYQKIKWDVKERFKKQYLISEKDLFEQLIALPKKAKTYIFRQALLSCVFNEYIGGLDHSAVSSIALSYSDQIGLSEIIENQNKAKEKREASQTEKIYVIERQIEQHLKSINQTTSSQPSDKIIESELIEL